MPPGHKCKKSLRYLAFCTHNLLTCFIAIVVTAVRISILHVSFAGVRGQAPQQLIIRHAMNLSLQSFRVCNNERSV